MVGPTMADAMATARQIVKTCDDCQIEGIDMATVVSRIEAHVLAYTAELGRLLAEADRVIVTTYGEIPEYGVSANRRQAITDAFKRHRARQSSPAQDEGKPPT